MCVGGRSIDHALGSPRRGGSDLDVCLRRIPGNAVAMGHGGYRLWLDDTSRPCRTVRAVAADTSRSSSSALCRTPSSLGSPAMNDESVREQRLCHPRLLCPPRRNERHYFSFFSASRNCICDERSVVPAPRNFRQEVIAGYSRFADGHRSQLLNSHLHRRWGIADPVLPLLGIPAKVRRRVVIAVHDAAALAVRCPHRKLAHLRLQLASHSKCLAGREPRGAFDQPRHPTHIGLCACFQP